MSSHIDKSAIDTARIAFEDAFKELVKLVETGAGKKELGHAAARYKFLMVHHYELAIAADAEVREQFPGISPETVRKAVWDAAAEIPNERFIASAKEFVRGKR